MVAKQSALFDHILVSTDDKKIAEVSTLCGAEVPFLRPVELSGDYIGMVEVIAHAVSWMYKQKWQPKTVCCMYATSVFLTVGDLKEGFNALSIGNWSYVFSVTDFGYPIFRSFKKSFDGGVEMFFPEHFDKRSQDFPEALHDAAQFYWGKPDAWLNKLKIFEHHSFPIMIPRWKIQDIDTEDDWKRAELLFNTIHQKV